MPARGDESGGRVRDSGAWRTWTKSTRVRNSGLAQSSDTARRYVLSLVAALRAPDRYGHVETLCLPVGHMKSGGSLLGALLDAHPNVAFADEVDALRYFEAGFHARQVFALLERGARREAMKGRVTARRLDPYSLAVPGQSQGRVTDLRVVGDSRAGIATQRLGADPALVDRVQTRLGDTKLRFVHVIRNPFDPIAVMRLRGRRTFDAAVERYFENCAVLDGLRARLPSECIHELRYEEMVADPVSQLRAVSAFVDLPVDEYFLAMTTVLVTPRTPERELVTWSPSEIRSVVERMRRHDFLAGYAFGDQGATA